MRFDSPLNAPAEAPQLSLFFDESLSSWKRRNYRLRRTIEFAARSFRDEDFGQLRLKEFIIPDQLFLQLQRAAELPDPWLLSPRNKQFCPRCLIEDWVSGGAPYARRSWRIAWHTCCPKHGLYERLELKSRRLFCFPLLCLTRPRWSKLDVIHLHARRSPFTNVVLGKDVRIAIVGRRGLHIQSALEGKSHRQLWYPHGIKPILLRQTYASVVKALMRQFDLDLEFSWGGAFSPPGGVAPPRDALIY